MISFIGHHGVEVSQKASNLHVHFSLCIRGEVADGAGVLRSAHFATRRHRLIRPMLKLQVAFRDEAELVRADVSEGQDPATLLSYSTDHVSTRYLQVAIFKWVEVADGLVNIKVLPLFELLQVSLRDFDGRLERVRQGQAVSSRITTIGNHRGVDHLVSLLQNLVSVDAEVLRVRLRGELPALRGHASIVTLHFEVRDHVFHAVLGDVPSGRQGRRLLVLLVLIILYQGETHKEACHGLLLDRLKLLLVELVIFIRLLLLGWLS